MPLCVIGLLVLARLVTDVGQPLFADDIWWHVALGRSFLENSGFPALEPLLFTSTTHAQFYHEWLFQLVVASADQSGGMALLRALQVVLVFVLLQQIFMFARLQGLGRVLAIAIAAATIFFALQRLVQFRPHLFSMIFFYAALNLYCVPALSLRRAAMLFTIVVLWANSHATVMLLFPFLIVYLIIDGRHFKIRSKAHLGGLAAALAAVALNPEAQRMYYFYFIHDRNNALVRIVDEWGKLSVKPDEFGGLPWSSAWVLAGCALVGIAILSLALSNLRRRTPTEQPALVDLHLLVWGVLAIIASAWAVRFLWLMPLALVAIACGWRAAMRSSYVRLVIATVTLGLVFIQQTSASSAGYRYQITRESVPIWASAQAVQRKFQPHAIRAIASSGYAGNLYTPYNLGGYASYILQPRVKVFFNGRYDSYSRQVYDDSFHMLRGGRALNEVVDRYAIDSFLLLLHPDSYKLIYTLELLGWCEGFHDESAIWLIAPEFVRHADHGGCAGIGRLGSASEFAELSTTPAEGIIEAVRHHRLWQATAIATAALPGELSANIRGALTGLCALHRGLAAELGVEASVDALKLCRISTEVP